MLKKTVTALSVAALAGVGALSVLPDAAKAAGHDTMIQLAACKPCNPCAAKMKHCNPCNPCAAKMKMMKHCNPCNPCAAKMKHCNPCNPCAAKKK